MFFCATFSFPTLSPGVDIGICPLGALTHGALHCLPVDAVWAVQWSATSEWVVITGGCDGAIRLWDVRRAGCFSILDHNKSWQAEKQHGASTGRRKSGRPGVTPQRGRQVCDLSLGWDTVRSLSCRWQYPWRCTNIYYCIAFALLQPICQALKP